jgi:hypothetical protein
MRSRRYRSGCGNVGRARAATTAALAFTVEALLRLRLERARQRATRLVHHGVHDLRANTHK